MKHFLILAIISVMALTGKRAMAQTNPIPNPGFEFWVNDSTASGWFSEGKITRTTDAHTGQFACEGKVSNAGQQPSVSTVYFDPTKHEILRGFLMSSRPSALEGWYKYLGVGNDKLTVVSNLFFNGDTVASALLNDSTVVGSYTHFRIPYEYRSGATPDTGFVGIAVTSGTALDPGTLHPGSDFVIDDLAMTGYARVTNQASIQQLSDAVYPNPTDGRFTVDWLQNRSEDLVRVEILNSLGEELTRKELQETHPGHHSVSFYIKTQSNGPLFYIIRLASGSIAQGSFALER